MGGVGLADFFQFFPGDIGLETVRDFLGAGDAFLLGKGLFLRVLDLVKHRFHLVVEVAGDLFGVFLGEMSIPYFSKRGPLKAKFCDDATLAATGTA